MGRKKKQTVLKPELDEYIKNEKKKRYATYKPGAELYGVGQWTFSEWAKKAGATINQRKWIIVDLDILDEYLERENKKNQRGGIDMPKVRKEIDKEKMEKLMVGHRKKFDRYDEGAAIYSMGKTTFRELARDAGAVYHVKGIVLVNTEIVDQYLENFRDDFLCIS